MSNQLSIFALKRKTENAVFDSVQVKEFANGYTLLREMGFPSNSVAEALLMFDNDTDKALAHVISNSS